VIAIDVACGALVVVAVDGLCGRECCCRGSEGRARHVRLLRRDLCRGSVVAAVFDWLPEDLSEVWVEGASGRTSRRVKSGTIVELAWMPPCPGPGELQQSTFT